MLDSSEMNDIVERHLNKNLEWEKKTVSVPVSGILEMEVTYFYNKSKNFAIIPSPLAVKEATGDAVEPSYEPTIAAIADEVGNNNFGIGCSLLGKGTGERHYTALYKEQGNEGKIIVFDSKISDPDKFFNSSDAPGFLEKAWGVISAPFKAFGLWAFNIGKDTQATFMNHPITVERLATQPFFDGVSCGYHSSGGCFKNG